jgi:hypothetical protein
LRRRKLSFVKLETKVQAKRGKGKMCREHENGVEKVC